MRKQKKETKEKVQKSQDSKDVDKNKIFGSKDKINPDAQKVEELTNLLQRTQAEFVNFKNRTEKESRQLLEFGHSDVLLKLLPALDSFELALKNSKEATEFKHGMELVYAQFMDVLGQMHVRPIDALGKKFDPHQHEVLMKEKSDKDEDIILEELQKGYMIKDKILRTTKVKVSG
jgi:molecular chaperone GrpE